MERLSGGLKDIFSTILKEQETTGTKATLPPIIILAGNGHVIAPGGTVNVVHHGGRDLPQHQEEP